MKGMLDENGKAYYGTPGPGSYSVATAFRKIRSAENNFYAEDDAGAQVFPRAGAYSMAGKPRKPEKMYVSKMHNATYYGSESPGPAYKYKDVTLRKAPQHAFSTADRTKEKKSRYISRDHCGDALGTDSPGPNAYRVKGGKGIARSMGDAPTWIFGTGEQHNDGINPSSRSYPGPGAYTVPGTLQQSPAFTFAPGDERQGRMRHRDESSFLWVSEEHAKAENATTLSNPGPGAYDDLNLDCVKLRHPVTAFPKNPRYCDKPYKIFISKHHTEPDPCSPGPAYEFSVDAVTTRKPHAAFQRAPRLLNPEQGGNKGGPYISHIHALTYAGANSPGPGTYDNKTGKGHYRTLGDCPLSVFGSEARNKLEKELEASRGVPGPGAYMIRESSGAPCYSMAANLRTDFTQGSDPDEPGPGHYDIPGLADSHPALKAPGKTKFGKSEDRSTFVTSQPGYDSPGPGSYSTGCRLYDVISAAPKISFGARDKRRAGGKAIAGYRYIGPLHASAEGLGADTPGPGHYEMKTGKGHAKSMGDAPNMTFGTGPRVNNGLFISDAHNMSVGDTSGQRPGPGHYDTSAFANTSKHKNRGGCSFGTAARPFGGSGNFLSTAADRFWGGRTAVECSRCIKASIGMHKPTSKESFLQLKERK